MSQDDLIGLKEIAELLGVARQTPRIWRHRGILPEPAAELSSGPVWYRSTILEWSQRTGHPRKGQP